MVFAPLAYRRALRRLTSPLQVEADKCDLVRVSGDASLIQNGHPPIFENDRAGIGSSTREKNPAMRSCLAVIEAQADRRGNSAGRFRLSVPPYGSRPCQRQAAVPPTTCCPSRRCMHCAKTISRNNGRPTGVPQASGWRARGSCQPCRIAIKRRPKQRTAPAVAATEDGKCNVLPITITAAPMSAATA